VNASYRFFVLSCEAFSYCLSRYRDQNCVLLAIQKHAIAIFFDGKERHDHALGQPNLHVVGRLNPIAISPLLFIAPLEQQLPNVCRIVFLWPPARGGARFRWSCSESGLSRNPRRRSGFRLAWHYAKKSMLMVTVMESHCEHGQLGFCGNWCGAQKSCLITVPLKDRGTIVGR